MDNETIIKVLTETAERAKSNSEKINNLEGDIKTIKEENKIIHEIATSVRLIAQDMTYIKTDIATVKETQSGLTEQVLDLKTNSNKIKAAWVDKAIAAILGALGTGVLAYLLRSILPNIFQ